MPYRPTANYKESLALNEIPDATETSAGVMSAADKARLDSLTPLTPTGVVAGSYTSTNLTVNEYGLVTEASNGGGGVTFANPTASLGLTAINGVATTAMRSDAAPALDQGISPTWSGTHTFSNATTFSTSVLSNLFDARTVTTLAIGTTTATGIGLNQTTTLAAGKSLSMAAGAGGLACGSGTGDAIMPTGAFRWTGASGKVINFAASGAAGSITMTSAATNSSAVFIEATDGSGGVVIKGGVGVTFYYASALKLSVGAQVNVASGTATPAGGSTSARLLFGTTAGFGVYYGSGAPTVSAAKGSLYLRSDGTGTNDRQYINTDGSTAWTAVVTAT